ncbi:MAG: diphthine--ammonia ligase [Candidatus Nezhaarchaeota archaeon]|nr:diphthine--ammonia ligase [Candidatus Nezhaarchaeota archaeon]
MNAACLWSGGKDSAYACYLASKAGFSIKRILTFSPQNPESYLFHVPNVRWTALHAKSMDLPQDLVDVPRTQERAALSSLLSGLKVRYEIDAVVSGVIKSRYQKDVFQEVCDEVGLKLITPIWGRQSLNLLEEVLRENFRAMVVGVYAEGLTSEWLAKELDHRFIERLKELHEKWEIDFCGEGGEYETFVIDAPCFKKKVKVLRHNVVWHRNWGEAIILEAELVDKELNA